MRGIKRGEDSKKERSTPHGAVELTAETVAFTLHFDSFRSQNRARKRVQSLKSLGLDAFSRRVDLPAKGIFHRVLVGQFENRGQAREFQAHLQRNYDFGESRIISAAAKH
jgi:cell division septation protein DedD